ncbi:IS3 family transposase [Bacillus sp. FJAT-42376]|uniref:IS3 family transposase n=1 Tax=Bacillus sp. FJAT-42376 TaxID=2014076 RepID=UPI000F4E8C96|nr:IS3 family transposase [Bacillus sp. FJAT-42376]AZB41708.1 IS3 family transposase [Bacillus sp. FJAT-42376]
METLTDKVEFAKEWVEAGFAVTRVINIVGISKSTYYYQQANPIPAKRVAGGRPIPGFSLNSKGKRVSDEQIKAYLVKLIGGMEAVYGYRKLTSCLKRKHHLTISKKKVYRLCKEMGILFPLKIRNNKYPRKIARNRIVTGPNQMWQIDIKYGYIPGIERFFYLASAIDVYDRKIVGFYLGKTCGGKDITKMLKTALRARNIENSGEEKLVLRTDNGPQFIGIQFQEFCLENKERLEHERIPPKSPNLNAYIESFHSVLERECYQRHEFQTFEEANEVVKEYIQFYNNKRLHGSLEDWPPAVYFQKHKKGEVKPRKIAL